MGHAGIEEGLKVACGVDIAEPNLHGWGEPSRADPPSAPDPRWAGLRAAASRAGCRAALPRRAEEDVAREDVATHPGVNLVHTRHPLPVVGIEVSGHAPARRSCVPPQQTTGTKLRPLQIPLRHGLLACSLRAFRVRSRVLRKRPLDGAKLLWRACPSETPSRRAAPSRRPARATAQAHSGTTGPAPCLPRCV